MYKRMPVECQTHTFNPLCVSGRGYAIKQTTAVTDDEPISEGPSLSEGPEPLPNVYEERPKKRSCVLFSTPSSSTIMKIYSDMSSVKPHIVLDIDQTLIHALEISDIHKIPDIKRLMVSSPFHNMDNDMVIFERPHLQQFLDYMFKNYEISIWTAANYNYASFVLERILRGRKPVYVLFDSHCELSSNIYRGTQKDLRLLSFVGALLVDDLKENCGEQNSICIAPYDVTKEDSLLDKELLVVMEMLENLSD
jgi:hypothetical protein